MFFEKREIKILFPTPGIPTTLIILFCVLFILFLNFLILLILLFLIIFIFSSLFISFYLYYFGIVKECAVREYPKSWIGRYQAA